MRLYGISNDGGFPLSASNSHFSAQLTPGNVLTRSPESSTRPPPWFLLSIATASSCQTGIGGQEKLTTEKSDLGSRPPPRWCI